MHVSIRLLGGFEVAVDGAPVPERLWRRRAAAALVKVLALQPGRRLRREQVIDRLWPDLPVRDAAPRLHTAAHYARMALGRRDGVVLAGDTVALLPGTDVAVDAAAFQAAADAVRDDGRPESAASALRLYGGDLLPGDLYESWAEEARETLRARYLDLLRIAGRWEDIAAADPLDEQAHLHVARSHLRAGRRSAALRQLAELERGLRSELGTQPSAAVGELRDQALALRPEKPEVPLLPAPTPVPAPATATVGRQADVARVLHLLGRGRIVTLLGAGGVGKTRLAVEVALRAGERDAAEAVFVDLTKVSDARSVPALIGAELGLHLGSNGEPERVLREALRPRSLLLVLDNVEHVLDAAGLVGRLVAHAPGLRVLCTSRIRLGLSGEQLFDVAPLPTGRRAGHGGDERSPAIALFDQVARAADAEFSLAAHLADVVAICRSVDGLPLAIELAAGQVRTLPPAQLRAQLRTRLRSPVGGGRDRHPRQRTIDATVDWSLQLLEPADRRLFAALGVFAGAVPLEAVEEVCGGDLDVVEGLSRLVDSSLVQRVGGPGGRPRFRLLALLRDRARALLPPETAHALRARHAAYVAAALEDVDERKWADTDPATDRIGDLLPEIRPAHDDAERRGDWGTAARITATLGTYWHRDGHHRAGRRWAEDALRHAAELDGLLVARLHIAAGFVTWTTDLPAAREHWTRAITLSRSLGNRRYLAFSLSLAAGSHVGNPPAYGAAMALCDEAIRLARGGGELPLIAAVLDVTASLARAHGEDDAALAAGEEGYALARKAQDQVYVARFLATLAHLALRRGNAAEAARLQREALTVSWSGGRPLFAAWSVSELAGPELALGRPRHAARLIGAADRALGLLGVARLPGDRREHEAVVQALRHHLGEEDFASLRAEGARLFLDEAVQLALAVPEEVHVPAPRQPAVLTPCG